MNCNDQAENEWREETASWKWCAKLRFYSTAYRPRHTACFMPSSVYWSSIRRILICFILRSISIQSPRPEVNAVFLWKQSAKRVKKKNKEKTIWFQLKTRSIYQTILLYAILRMVRACASPLSLHDNLHLSTSFFLQYHFTTYSINSSEFPNANTIASAKRNMCVFIIGIIVRTNDRSSSHRHRSRCHSLCHR